jgi:tRNA modification GTPase
MYVPDETIVAIATPPGRGGVAVVRLSGKRAVRIGEALVAGSAPLEARRATVARVRARGVEDEAVVTWFAAPASYTGEDVVELSVHGSPVVARAVVAAAVREGARVARAGEFTLRAFLNGKLDLAQAEAVQDLVAATTPEQARMAFDQLQGTLSGRIGAVEQELFDLSARLEASVDFPEEGYHFVEAGDVAAVLRRVESGIAGLLRESRRGRLLRDGATVAIVGATNVGKSTVFNRLAGSDRAIVTEIAGTTRDLVTEGISVEGVPVTLVDTAGARVTEDPVEREGVERAARARDAADLLVVVLDGSRPLEVEDLDVLRATASKPRVVVMNKSDLPARADAAAAGETVLRVAAVSGAGIDALVSAMAARLGAEQSGEPAAISNARHVALLESAARGVRGTIDRLECGLGQIPEEVILAEIRATRDALEEITGQRTTEELLERIFSRFCVGK